MKTKSVCLLRRGLWNDMRVRARAISIVVTFVSVGLQTPVFAQGPNDAMVYLDSAKQVIRGFGAANIVRWRPDMTTSEIEKAFGTGPGQIGFTILRLRVPPQSSDFVWYVPTAQAAHSKGVTIIASPWSPPASMKTNNNIVGGRLRVTSYSAYAAHLKSFVDYMASNGVPLYAISVQNEPDIQVTYESCDWNADEMVKFVKENGRDVGTKLIAPESFNFNPTIANAILNDPAAAQNIDIIGGHIYGGGLAPYPLAAAKGKEHWMTEHLDLDTSWTAVLATGREISDCMSVGMNAYIWWYIVRFYGPIDDGERGGVKGDVTKRGYVMSQFARFIRPGYRRILSTYPARRPVFVTAYKGGSKLIVVALNTGSTPLEQTILFEGLPNGSAVLTPYVTTATKNCVQENQVTASNGNLTVMLEASSITTFVADGIATSVESPGLPQAFKLSQNYPNPFNSSTIIRFELPVSSRVSLNVFDVLGRKVASLVQGEMPAGYHEVRWNAEDASSAFYFYRMEAGSGDRDGMQMVDTRRMLLLR